MCKILQIFMSITKRSHPVPDPVVSASLFWIWVRIGVQNLKTRIRSKNVMRIRSGSTTTLVLSFQNSVRVQGAHTRRAVGSGAPSEDSQLPLLYGGLINISFSSYKFSVLECFYILGSKCSSVLWISAYFCAGKLFDLCNIFPCAGFFILFIWLKPAYLALKRNTIKTLPISYQPIGSAQSAVKIPKSPKCY